MAPRRHQNIRNPTPRREPPPGPATPRPLPLWRGTKWTLATIGATLGVVASVYGVWGPVWPTAPEIRPHDATNGSSLMPPFEITNRSVLFDLDADLNCAINLLYFMDADGRTGLLRDGEFSMGRVSIRPAASASYPCDASRFAQIRPNGSMVVGFPAGGQSMETKPGVFKSPMTILKMCLAISGTYNVLGGRPSFSSTMFQWPAAPSRRQWTEVSTALDDDQSKWIPEGSKLAGAWGVVRQLTEKSADGTVKLLPDALRCDPVF